MRVSTVVLNISWDAVVGCRRSVDRGKDNQHNTDSLMEELS